MSFTDKEGIQNICLLLFLYLVFWLSFIYTSHEQERVSYKYSSNDKVEILGEIVSSEVKGGKQTLTLRVGGGLPEYINIQVSESNKYELYDQLKVLGVVNLNNFETYYSERPLFFTYEFEKLFYNTPYTVSYPSKIEIMYKDKNIWERFVLYFFDISETLKSKIGMYMSEPYAGIASGISMGQQDNIIKSIKDIFKQSGLVHILVLSGANVSFIIILFSYFLRNLKTNFIKKYNTTLLIIFSWFFIFLTGLQPPSVRAGIMATTNILSEQYGKNISAFYSLLFSLFILTILSPLSLIYSASLHLSYLACFGLFIAAPKIEKYLKIKSSFFAKYTFLNFLTSTFIGIFIFTTPYVLALTGSSSLFGTILTILVEPFVFLTTILSFLIILFSFISSPIAQLFSVLNTLSVKFILSVANFGANHLPLVSFHIGKVSLLIYYLILTSYFVILGKDNESK